MSLVLVRPASPPIMLPEVKQSGWKIGRKDQVSEMCLAAMWHWTGHRPRHCSAFLIRTENDTMINGSQAKVSSHHVSGTRLGTYHTGCQECCNPNTHCGPCFVEEETETQRNNKSPSRSHTAHQKQNQALHPVCFTSWERPAGWCTGWGIHAPWPSPLITLSFCWWYYAHYLAFLCLLHFICKLEKITVPGYYYYYCCYYLCPS